MTEAERAMRMAADEIRSLRRRNEVLSAKVEMIDLFALVFTTRPAYPSQGMGEDAVWLLEKAIAASASAIVTEGEDARAFGAKRVERGPEGETP